MEGGSALKEVMGWFGEACDGACSATKDSDTPQQGTGSICNQGFNSTFKETNGNICLVKVDGLCRKKNSHRSYLKVSHSSVDVTQQHRCRERFVERKQDVGLSADSLS